MPRDEEALARAVSEALDVPFEEALTYVASLKAGRLEPKSESEEALAKSLAARGMVILEAGGGSYRPVHPRMAMSNLFRTFEEKAVRERKEKRLLVDRLTLQLITLLPGESKGTNAGGAGVGRKEAR